MTETTVSRQAALDDEALTAALGALTLEEKVQLLTGRDFWNTWPIEKIGLRRILVSDGPSGVRGEAWDERDPSLNLPSATALASAWDPEIARRYGAAAAVEARRKGVDVVLGPTINLHRSPLGGRHFESLSEDPVLTAELAASYVKGAQDNGVGATPKHYIANDSETDRFTVDARVSDRALHELYLLAFEKAIKEAHAWLVMSSYNSVNGVTATENALLETPLNSEWGFDGVVISDWTAVRSLESAKAAQDLVMPGPEGPWGAALVEAVRAGQIDESVVDRKVLRILRLAQRVGALEGTSPVEPALVEDGATFAREAAVAGTVLLANNGILPLDTTLRRVAVIGHNAWQARTQGGGSATVIPEKVVTPLQAIRAALPDAEVSYSLGAVVQQGIAEFPLDQITNPATGEPGAFVRFLEADGSALYTEDRRATALIYFGGDAPIAKATTVEISLTWTPDEDGEFPLGFAAVGHGRVFIDGELRLEETAVAEGADLGAALLSPPAATTPVTVRAGTPIDVRIEFDLRSRVRMGGMEGIFGITIGVEPALSDPDTLIIEAARAAAEAEVAVVVVGTNSQVESEGFDRKNTHATGPTGRARRGCGRGEPAHRRPRQCRRSHPDALARRCRRAAGDLLRWSGDGQRRRRRPVRRRRARRPAADDLGRRGDRHPGAVDRAGERRVGLHRRHPHRLPRVAQKRRRAGLLVRLRPRLHRHRCHWGRRSAYGIVRGGRHGCRRGREPRLSGRQAGGPGVRRARRISRGSTGALAGRVCPGPGCGRPDGAGRRTGIDPSSRLLGGRLDIRAGRLPAAGRHQRREPACRGEPGAPSMSWPNPLISGFNPDPSVVLVDGVYYLATSTFEYLPGLPVYRSTDLVDWTQIGNVATRPEQIGVENAPTGGGVWAPTIRHHDGVFYLIVTIAFSDKGCVVFTRDGPSGTLERRHDDRGYRRHRPRPRVGRAGQRVRYIFRPGHLRSRLGQASGHRQPGFRRWTCPSGKALEEPHCSRSGRGPA